MKKFTILFTLLCCTTLSFCTTHQGYVNTYAVVVAIADYENYEEGGGDLRFSDDDAAKFYEFLCDANGGKVPRDNISLLINQRATRANILRQLHEVFARATADDRIIFYYSGHGVPGLLIPYDVKGKENVVTYAELKNAFKKSKASIKLCLIDACNANSIKITPSTTPKTTTRTAQATEVAIMVSSQSYQSSIEFESLGQGVFSYFLLKGLRGSADRNKDNIINIAELHTYIYKNVKVYTGNAQVPHTYGRFNKTMPIAILGKRAQIRN